MKAQRKFLRYDLGTAGPRQRVVADLDGVASNVMLLDRPNLTRFKKGEQFTYTGGLAKTSPVTLGIPYDADWTLVVQPAGQGTVRVSGVKLTNG